MSAAPVQEERRNTPQRLALFSRHKALHLWLGIDLALLLAFFLLRRSRPLMNLLAQGFALPLQRALGRLFYGTSVSMMEVFYVLFGLGMLAYVIAVIAALVRRRENRRQRAYVAAVRVACIGLSVYAGFCLLWGVSFWTDSFQDRSGIVAQSVAREDLEAVTAYFARQLSKTAYTVPRDENEVFALPVAEILNRSKGVYDGIEAQMPFLSFADTGVKAMAFSHLMSVLDFTGFYCPYTGESNVNIESPACLLPATAAHEMAHQRGIASEQECNFLAVLASTLSGEPAYIYSGYLMGYIHLGNALYSVDPEGYWAIRQSLPAAVEADLAYNNAYWDQFRDSRAQKISNKVYDGVLKVYGDERGIQSYGTVVDLLVVYYREAAGHTGTETR